jgi:hypothetical protein
MKCKVFAMRCRFAPHVLQSEGGGIMTDKQMLHLVQSLRDVDEYRKKQIAILLMHDTLNGYASEELAGYAAGLADIKQGAE